MKNNVFLYTGRKDWIWLTDFDVYKIEIEGEVRNLTTYGAFIELEDGIDGMIHVSDISWTRKINHPSEVLKKGDPIKAVVLDVDIDAQRISKEKTLEILTIAAEAR